MAMLFDSTAMAEGYAFSRPAVHPRVMEKVRARLRLNRPFKRALDVGCGAGLSTAALAGIARQRVGVDPFESMVRLGGRVAPGAEFVLGKAEALPFADGSVDFVTAAGSLNFTEVEPALREIQRVLRWGGHLVVYDFGQGREFTNSASLTTWHEEFKQRYPSPPARALDPGLLPFAAAQLTSQGSSEFVAGLPISPEFYLDYAMTETNVSAAVAQGTPAAEIRAWCEESLRPVFAGETRTVLFRGYVAYAAKGPALEA